MIPHLQIVAPIEETITLLVPSMAACALLGWRTGGKVTLAIIWTALALLVLTRPVSPNVAYDGIVRAWSLILAATFAVVSLSAGQRPLFPRALTSTAVTFAVTWGLLLGSTAPEGHGVGRFNATLEAQVVARGEEQLQNWNATASTPEWKELESKNQAVINLSAEVVRFWQEVPKATSRAVPALLALESIAALALVWGLFHRVSRVRLGPPLGKLRDFRFNDQLIWGLVVGITLVVLPSLAALRGLGLNLLVFLGVLYLLRGLGVLSWFLAPRRIAWILLIVVVVFSWPIIGLFSIGLGLGDTWLDLRRRMRPTS